MNLAPVTAIIISYNTCELTHKALTALLAGSIVPRQIIVVDNNSIDGSAEMVMENFPGVQFIKNPENIGFARANNLAIRDLAKEEFIWLLNSDTEVGKNSLVDALTYLEANTAIAGVEPTLVYPNGSLQSVGGYFPNILNVFYYLVPVGYLLPISLKQRLKSIALFPQSISAAGIELDYITGAAAIFRREVLDQVGLLGAEYFMYFEETDLCYRIARAGYKLMGIKTDPVMHVYGGSFKGKADDKRLRMFLSSLELFVKKNYSKWYAQIIILEIRLFGELSIFLKGLRQ
ncbi:MAG: glycosyltransferase family 2 protein [bacterium]